MTRFIKLSLASLIAFGTLAATADASFARSRRSFCQAQARSAARHVGGDHVVTGLALGAAGGGLIGALSGNNNFVPGLAIGAVGGTMAGAVSGSEAKRQAYWETYQNCMGNY